MHCKGAERPGGTPDEASPGIPTAVPLAGDALLQRFAELDSFLCAHQQLWRPRPFVHLQLPWEAECQELSAWLRQRSLAEAEADHHHPERLHQAPEPFASLARHSARLSEVGPLSTSPASNRPARQHSGIPGRKLQQIDAFASALSFNGRTGHWLDWCAGKGHLGHWLSHGGAPLTCLERDPQLVLTGRALSSRLGRNAEHRQMDVMQDDPAFNLQPTHTPVALHACGDLHVRLLQQASAAGCRQLAVAPCCFNRIAAPHYQPLSSAGTASTLVLSRDDLALPLSETVTGGARVRRQRDQSMAWRLAFDLLQRQIRGTDDYLPTPSLPAAWLDKPFAGYCLDLGEMKGLSIDGRHDWAALEAAGWQRLAAVRNLELLRNLFRRPLEIWLALDKSLYLQEQGYRTRLGTFCQHHLTPRNLLIIAEQPPVDNSVENL